VVLPSLILCIAAIINILRYPCSTNKNFKDRKFIAV